jgi:hypothetical protein
MTPFTSTNSTTHSSTISNLSNGRSYIYYVKCSDLYNNTNLDDYLISFSVANDAGGSGGLITNYVPPAITPVAPIITTPAPTKVGAPLLNQGGEESSPPSVATATAGQGGVPAEGGGFHFTLNIKQGSKGNEVKELQKYLNAKLNLHLITDGNFGPLTKKAVIKFQLQNKLFPDGVVGPLTRRVLNASTPSR